VLPCLKRHTNGSDGREMARDGTDPCPSRELTETKFMPESFPAKTLRKGLKFFAVGLNSWSGILASRSRGLSPNVERAAQTWGGKLLKR
jgi:hypothetical protein